MLESGIRTTPCRLRGPDRRVKGGGWSAPRAGWVVLEELSMVSVVREAAGDCSVTVPVRSQSTRDCGSVLNRMQWRVGEISNQKLKAVKQNMAVTYCCTDLPTVDTNTNRYPKFAYRFYS